MTAHKGGEGMNSYDTAEQAGEPVEFICDCGVVCGSSEPCEDCKRRPV